MAEIIPVKQKSQIEMHPGGRNHPYGTEKQDRDADKFQFNEEVLYMKKSISRIIGLIMLIIAIVFIMFALNHPEKSFPWNNTITWLLYGIYFLVTVVLLIAPKMKK